MIRVAVASAARPLVFRAGSRCLAGAFPTVVTPTRHFSWSPLVSAPDELTAGGKGSEGHHIRDAKATSPNANKALPTGDWVLFHPAYSKEEMKAVKVVRHPRKTVGDHIAGLFVRALRFGFDIVSMYHHKEIPPGSNMTLKELRAGNYSMGPDQWLNRILFLESTAAVPGMVAATCRHLRSLRLMRRDAGWIHTLLEEAENERMHLLTFLTLRKPSIFFRALILGAQGVFYNLFFMTYLINPRICHRFVGILEEEAVYTYTFAIKDIEEGRLPEWADKPAPKIAIDYWRLAPDASLLDVIYAVRSDESTHRFVNHTLANVNYAKDVNPFAVHEPDMFVKGQSAGFSREEAEEHVRESYVVLNGGTGKEDKVPKSGPSSGPTLATA